MRRQHQRWSWHPQHEPTHPLKSDITQFASFYHHHYWVGLLVKHDQYITYLTNRFIVKVLKTYWNMCWWFLVTDTFWITFQIVPDPAPDTEPDPGSAVVSSGKWYVQLFSVRSKCSFSFNFSQTLKFCSDFVLKKIILWSGCLVIWEVFKRKFLPPL